MNVIKYNVNSGDVCHIGRQYEYGKTQVIFEGYQVNDSANEIYFKFVGRTEDSKYLIPIVDMTLDITQQLTKHVGQFSCQLEEMNTEGTLVSQSPVFYVAVKRSIKVGADYEVQDPRLETIYQKYNEMYNIISQTNETSLANESQRKAEWLTLKQEVSDAINGIDGSLDTYKAETTQMLEFKLAECERQTTSNISTALKTYETQTDANLNEKFQTYSAKVSSDINRMFDDSDRTSKEKIDGYISEIEQRRIAGEFNGSDGYTPVKGVDYFDGVNGKSAYQIAVDNGFIGTEAEWLASLRGADGKDGMQPDWNQNDETAQDYVKNRPFYMGDPVETVLVEESTALFEDDGGIYFSGFESTFEATVGETYKVSWDGTTYECTCRDFDGSSWIGNPSIIGLGSDTGEPFLMRINDGIRINIMTIDTSASHTFSISGIVREIVKIPAKFIDKDTSGYIVVHNGDTMTEEEANNYIKALLKGEAVFISWESICIYDISTSTATDSTGASVVCLDLHISNGEIYEIAQNSEGLFSLGDRKLLQANFPAYRNNGEKNPDIGIINNKVNIFPSEVGVGVGTTNTLFSVNANGTKSKNFDVLGNGEAVAPALILYSSTPDSTKKFRITVDDSGTISANEVT